LHGRLGNSADRRDPVYLKQMEYELGVIRQRKNAFDYIYMIGIVVRWRGHHESQPTIPSGPFHS